MLDEIDIVNFGSGSSGNSTLISWKNYRLLLDAGVKVKRIVEKITAVKLMQVDGVLITHEHQDHAYSVKTLLERRHNIYMTMGTAEALGLDIKNIRVHIIKAGEVFTIKNWIIMPFKSFHDAAEPVNFLVTMKNRHYAIAYITDTGKAPYKLKGLTHLIIEANYSKEILSRNLNRGVIDKEQFYRIIDNHLSIEQVLYFLKNNDREKLKKIYLQHLSDRNSNAFLFKRAVQKLTGIQTEVF